MNDNLTLDKIKQTYEQFVAKQTAEEADSYIRLGEQGYHSMQVLKEGGTAIIGTKGETLEQLAESVKLRATIIQEFPKANVYLTQFVDHGVVYVMPKCDLL